MSKFTRVMICFFCIFVVLCAVIVFFFRKKDDPPQIVPASIILPEIPADINLENMTQIKKTMLQYQLYFTPYMRQIVNLPEFDHLNELTFFDKLAFAAINSSSDTENFSAAQATGVRLRQIVSRCLGADLPKQGQGVIKYDSVNDMYNWQTSSLKANSHVLVFSDIEQSGNVFKAYFLAYPDVSNFDYTDVLLSSDAGMQPVYIQSISFTLEYDEDQMLFLRYHSCSSSSVSQ